MSSIEVHLDNTIDGYRQFIAIKQLPRYEIHGRMAVVPDEYASLLGIHTEEPAAVGYRAKATSGTSCERRFKSGSSQSSPIAGLEKR